MVYAQRQGNSATFQADGLAALKAAVGERTIRRMKKSANVTVMHVPDTGHTPVLSDRNQNWFIHEWLMGRTQAHEWCVLHARPRDEELETKMEPAAKFAASG